MNDQQINEDQVYELAVHLAKKDPFVTGKKHLFSCFYCGHEKTACADPSMSHDFDCVWLDAYRTVNR